MKLVVFNQTRAEGAALGAWCLMDVEMYQLITALGFPVGARHQPSDRIYTVTSPSLPPLHDLTWGSDLEGERRLSQAEATAQLEGGSAIQVFIYNGDSDCVRHYLVLPVGEPVFWLPDQDKR